MGKADDGYKKLKPDERGRNKRTGDIYLFINKQNLDTSKLENLDTQSAEERLDKLLANEEVKDDPEDKTLKFGDKDIIDGKCFKV